MFGPTQLQKYFYPSGVNYGERQALVACVDAFMKDWASRANGTVKVLVAWDCNDYQVRKISFLSDKK